MSWNHKTECDEQTCYCLDDDGDPICDCGNPAWACCCPPPDEDEEDEYSS